ncbi:uncharacterized protein C13G5.2-like [Athalia rosae]|uniref:uncharacterized protein C13G5.2-like n=1 Tax=Athalia rosae TaxID=37344 RepID=UPI0020345895|nr:uncharacterized protein C13G5.2-like [Athalia rosae]
MVDEKRGAEKLQKRLLQSSAIPREFSFRTAGYKTTLPKRGAVNIFKASSKPGTTKWNWMVRLDTPHKGANFHHMNINPKLAGIRRDPHIPIPANSVKVAVKTAKFLKKVNTVLVPTAVAIDSFRVASNVYKDYGKGTTRNTVETVAEIGGSWAGGSLGSSVGCTIGTAIFPGIGTLVGGIFGGVVGAISGVLGTEAIARAIGDQLEYDIKVCICHKCTKQYNCRKYTGQPTDSCSTCSSSSIALL